MAVDFLLASIWRTQFLAAAIVGVVCVLLAVIVARLLTHADIQELKSLVQSNKCQCEARNVTADASGNRLVIAPDENSMGQLTREVLQKRGNIE